MRRRFLPFIIENLSFIITYDSSGELLLALPESRGLKESSQIAQVEPFVPIRSGGKLSEIPDRRSGAVPIIGSVQQAALTALKMHGSAEPIYAGAPLHRSAAPRQLGASPAPPALRPSASLPHAEMGPSDNRCLTEVIQHQEQVHGVLVGWIGLPVVEPQMIPLWKTILRTTRCRIEDLMRLQEEMDALSSEILDNYRGNYSPCLPAA